MSYRDGAGDALQAGVVPNRRVLKYSPPWTMSLFIPNERRSTQTEAPAFRTRGLPPGLGDRQIEHDAVGSREGSFLA